MPIKFKEQMKAHKDEQQAKFNTQGQATLKQKPKITIESRYSMTEQFACPFCLGLHKLQKYLISTKKGIHQGLAECPECHNKCRFTTLTEINTPEQYAEFAYPYSSSGFWQKVPFNKWKDRLYRLGWAPRFWNRYQQLKAESIEDNVDSEFERQQLEWATEAGVIK